MREATSPPLHTHSKENLTPIITIKSASQVVLISPVALVILLDGFRSCCCSYCLVVLAVVVVLTTPSLQAIS